MSEAEAGKRYGDKRNGAGGYLCACVIVYAVPGRRERSLPMVPRRSGAYASHHQTRNVNPRYPRERGIRRFQNQGIETEVVGQCAMVQGGLCIAFAAHLGWQSYDRAYRLAVRDAQMRALHRSRRPFKLAEPRPRIDANQVRRDDMQAHIAGQRTEADSSSIAIVAQKGRRMSSRAATQAAYNGGMQEKVEQVSEGVDVGATHSARVRPIATCTRNS